MQVPRVRFTMRRLMVAVAAMAIVLGLRHRSESLERTALYHRDKAFACHREFGVVLSGSSTTGESVDHRLEDLARCEFQHMRLADRYRLAACHPWLPVAPYPPEPE